MAVWIPKKPRAFLSLLWICCCYTLLYDDGTTTGGGGVCWAFVVPAQRASHPLSTPPFPFLIRDPPQRPRCPQQQQQQPFQSSTLQRSSSSSSSSSPEDGNSETTTSTTTTTTSTTNTKTIYQRFFYRLPRRSSTNDDDDDDEREDDEDWVDLEIPNPMVIEERLRYQVPISSDDDDDDDDDDDSTVVVTPVGPRTFVLREGTSEPGKIGNPFCTIHIPTTTTTTSTNQQHHHGGPQPSAWRDAMATALYFSANPTQFLNDQVLQLSCVAGSSGGGDRSSATSGDYGLATLLGCLGAAHALAQQSESETSSSSSDHDNDGSTTTAQEWKFPPSLQQVTLTDDSTDHVQDIMTILKKAGFLSSPSSSSISDISAFPSKDDDDDKNPLSSSSNNNKILVEPLEWNSRKAALSSSSSFSSRLNNNNKEYNTILAAKDGLYSTYPEAKELARFVAHSLKPSQPFLVNVNQQRDPIPRFVHLSSYDDYGGSGRGGISPTSTSSVVWYLQKVLQEGFLMSVDSTILSMDHIEFAIQTVGDDDETEEGSMDDNDNQNAAAAARETAAAVTTAIAQPPGTTPLMLPDGRDPNVVEEALLDPLVLEVQDWKTVEYRVVTAQHHPDYLGGGTGEYFFPLETGAWEQ